MVARFTRILPLLVVMALVAAVIYVAVSWRSSPNRAKELLIRIFFGINGLICVFFGLAALYAFFESNSVAVELALSFFAMGAIGLVVTAICRAIFRQNHPHYRFMPVEAEVINPPIWQRIAAEVLRRLLHRR